MKTVSVLIGNSDDKLSQREWHNFVEDLKSVFMALNADVYFGGAPGGCAPWQNYCIVADVKSLVDLLRFLEELRKKYHQDEIAVVIGETQFVKGGNLCA